MGSHRIQLARPGIQSHRAAQFCQTAALDRVLAPPTIVAGFAPLAKRRVEPTVSTCLSSLRNSSYCDGAAGGLAFAGFFPRAGELRD